MRYLRPVLYDFTLSATDSGLEFEINVDPEKRVYCLVGENAVGKTALLESLAQVMLASHAIWRSSSEPEKGPSGRSYMGWKMRTGFRTRFEGAQLRVPDATVAGRSIKGGKHWGTMLPLEPLHETRLDPVLDRPFVFVPAQGRASIADVGSSALRLVGDAQSAWFDAIDQTLAASTREPADQVGFARWVTSRLLVNPAFVAGMRQPADEVAALFELAQRFDPAAFGGALTVKDGRRLFSLVLRDGNVLLLGRPIDKLASGWTALLKILQQVVGSIAAWEAVRESNDILGSDALVFIDEIEAHLHPKWQCRILSFLKENFRNATFVVTTHSPLVLRDTDAGEAYELRRNGSKVIAERIGSPRDWYFSDVLRDAFHVALPAPGTQSDGQPALNDVLLTFDAKVRSFMSSKDPSERDEALSLYASIEQRLPVDDPRLRTVEQLRTMLG